MSSTGKSSSMSPMKIGDYGYRCVHAGGTSATEAVRVRTGVCTVDVVKFVGVTCYVDASICIRDKPNTL